MGKVARKESSELEVSPQNVRDDDSSMLSGGPRAEIFAMHRVVRRVGVSTGDGNVTSEISIVVEQVSTGFC